MTTTRTAAQWLASIQTALTAESYQQLAIHLENIAQEHRIEQLSETHVALALRRMGNDGNHPESRRQDNEPKIQQGHPPRSGDRSL